MKNSRNLFSKFLLLWTGEFISSVGSGLTAFGLGVYVFTQTGKASAMAMVTLMGFLPSLLLSAPAGVLADRFDRRLLMVLGDSLSALGLIFILFCMLRGQAKLWQICVGVTVSSVFSSLPEPAYKATVTDLLTKEQFTKASGLIQLAGSAKYLISPLLAGFLLSRYPISLLLILDICTFFVTAASTLAVRRGLSAQKHRASASLLSDFQEGWYSVTGNRGVLMLVMMAALITFCLGFIQTLITPLVLAFAGSPALGMAETLSAMGMLASGMVIGLFPLQGSCVRVLSLSLFSAGIFMALFALRENLALLCLFGFLFFAALPFANASLDYLIRTNISNDRQGRAWGIVGVISQSGYAAAYLLSGVLADCIFTPLLTENGPLAGTVGKILGTGSGRGTALLIITAGVMLSIISLLLPHIKSIQALESGGPPCM